LSQSRAWLARSRAWLCKQELPLVAASRAGTPGYAAEDGLTQDGARALIFPAEPLASQTHCGAAQSAAKLPAGGEGWWCVLNSCTSVNVCQPALSQSAASRLTVLGSIPCYSSQVLPTLLDSSRSGQLRTSHGMAP
jgi:hypothetical protein